MNSTASVSSILNSLRPRKVATSLAIAAGLLAWHFSSVALANPWVPIANPATPAPGNDVPTPKQVPGKDFSDIRDRDAPGVFDPEQVVAWDGSGGVRDSFDYSGSRALYPQDTGVDGIAAGGDALFAALRANESALLFSTENDSRIHYVRPTGLPNPTPGFGVWATATDVDATIPPIDLDGLELWGDDNLDDSDRYSLADDPFVAFPDGSRKVAIWRYNPGTKVSDPHTLTTDLAAAMDLQYGGIGVNGSLWSQLVELMDVDAIMTFGPQVTFSIRPLDLSQIDPLLPNFDGGEIFLYDNAGTPTKFLSQGGYTWDTQTWRLPRFGLPNDYRSGWMCYQWQAFTYNALEKIVKKGKCFRIARVGLVESTGSKKELIHNWVAITAFQNRCNPPLMFSVPASACTVYLDPWIGEGPAAFCHTGVGYEQGHPPHNFEGTNPSGSDPTHPTGMGGVYKPPTGDVSPSAFEGWSW